MSTSGGNLMYQGVERGGRAVPHISLKLDVCGFVGMCEVLAGEPRHPAFYFARLWLAIPFRFLVGWDNRVPKSERLPQHYNHWVKWAKRYPECRDRAMVLDHRALYAALLDRICTVRVYGVEEKVWRVSQTKGLENRWKDLNWLGVHGRLPVRDVLYRHSLTRNKQCPREGCLGEETVRHAFWECGFAKRVWGEVGLFYTLLGGLSYEAVMRGKGYFNLRGRNRFLWWFVISLTKFCLWEARGVLIKKNIVWGVGRVVGKVRGEIRRRSHYDVTRWGYHQAKERWKGLVDG